MIDMQYDKDIQEIQYKAMVLKRFTVTDIFTSELHYYLTDRKDTL